MGFKCGIVGLPNVGKSTLFNALTQAGIGAENFPFCTIEPNAGLVSVPDVRLQALANLVKPEKTIPTYMEFVDIAGLVKGASKGEGLGNQFLANIRETDAIAQVVRCFDDDNVIHVANRVDPVDDVGIINLELAMADLDSVQKQIQRTQKIAKSGDKEAKQNLVLLDKLEQVLSEGQGVRTLQLSKEEQQAIKSFHLLTAKPVLYIANVAEDGFEDNPYLDAMRKLAAEENAELVVVCNQIEAEISELEDADKAEFLATMGMKEPGLDRVIQAGYRILNLHTYFTAGPKEVRAWTVTKTATAPQAAGVIHTDFEKGFIRAEVISYDDYIQHQGEQGAKEAGKWRLEGKSYIVNDGDIVHFRFNV